jgi:UDP-sugar pyrophosphorylase
MKPYLENLNKTCGVMSEFVNPKYTDSSRTKFKKATRLECMMQDYPKILPPTSKVGFTLAPVWFCYSPCKNNINDAKKSQLTTPGLYIN